MATDRALPHDLVAERAVLGGILLDSESEALVEVRGIISADPFFSEAHTVIFSAMCRLADRCEPIDPLTLNAELGEDLERAGGPAYAASLVDDLPRAVNVAHYARIIKGHAASRRLARLGQRLRDAALAGRDTGELVAEIAAVNTANAAEVVSGPCGYTTASA